MAPAPTLFIGLDGHNDAIAVAYVAQAHGAEVPSLGPLGTRQGALDPRSRTMHAQAKPLSCVSAAGPCGSWLSRYCTPKGDDCWAVAPALLPPHPGDRVTTDRRDALPLARRARSGARTAVSGPTVAEKAIRELTRAREETLSARQDAKVRLKAFWLRQAMRSVGRAHGNPASRRWLAAVVCPTPAQHLVLQAYGRAVHDHTARLPRRAPALQAQGQAWRLSPVVAALQALRGVHGTVAVPRVAASGALRRFETPRALLTCLGRMPSEATSAERHRQGAMLKAGNPSARRVLGAGAWASRYPAQGSRHRHRRLATPPTGIQDLRWQAQVRRWKRSRRLGARGKHAHVVPGAIARELAGGMWAMAQEVPGAP